MTQWVNFKTVREHLSFRDVLAHSGIDENRQGDQIKIIRPFHNDHKPSCGVNLERQVYNYFAGNAGGNALDFVAHMEAHDAKKPSGLHKAAMFAANTFGIAEALQKPAIGRAAAASGKPGRSKGDANNSPEPRPRAVSDKQATRGKETSPPKPSNPPLTFSLALDHKHPFIDARGVKPKLIKKFGIGYCNRGSRKGRIAFPIHNTDGGLIAYSGRWASEELPEDIQRYLLPKGFEKSRALCNLHRVIKRREKHPGLDTVVIVEGFWSVLRLHAAKIPCVSTFGYSVSEAQAELLVQHGFKHVILIFSEKLLASLPKF